MSKPKDFQFVDTKCGTRTVINVTSANLGSVSEGRIYLEITENDQGFAEQYCDIGLYADQVEGLIAALTNHLNYVKGDVNE